MYFSRYIYLTIFKLHKINKKKINRGKQKKWQMTEKMKIKTEPTNACSYWKLGASPRNRSF